MGVRAMPHRSPGHEGAAALNTEKCEFDPTGNFRTPWHVPTLEEPAVGGDEGQVVHERGGHEESVRAGPGLLATCIPGYFDQYRK